MRQYDSTAPPLRRRRRRRSSSRSMIPSTKMLLVALCSVLVVVSLLVFVFLSWYQRSLFDDRIHQHMLLYERTYNQGRLHQSATSSVSQIKRPRHVLSHTYGVTHCPVTILFMDPRIGDPNHGSHEPAWFALESAAAFAPDACILLMTSFCVVQQERTIQDWQAKEATRDNIYTKALPLFRDMIDAGKVRLSFVDADKYKLGSCSNYRNPSAALMNYHFWHDEFLDMEGDQVILLQDDSVFCRKLDMKHFRNVAYVGGVWPPVANQFVPYPEEGMCQGMANRWSTWLTPQKRWERTKDKALEPKQVLNADFPTLCKHGIGPIGNGGFSLRSRRWTMQAIETCPHVKYSGLETDNQHLACKVMDEINEDLYFSIVLRGIGAPFPSVSDAASFAVEGLFREDAIEKYGVAPHLETDDHVALNVPQVQYKGRTLTIPIGMHKPFWYMPNEFLLSKPMSNACPFLRFVFAPEMSKWEATPKPKPRWEGIGS